MLYKVVAAGGEKRATVSYCIYLRKSRSDLEAEARGEEETLARHEKALQETAKRQKLPILTIYREVVSGETIVSRPVMQQLLAEVEQGMWQGVLVTEVERLARGDTIDQGIVAQAFKYSDTKIITPAKTFDPQNEFDEEYFEFGLFMSRREYKTINRRLQNGRLASAKEGKFVGSIAPFGYRRIKLQHEKGYSLDIVPEEAEIVRLIFSLYTEGELNQVGSYERLGVQAIARRLNRIGIRPIRHDYWQKETIIGILTNPTYAGRIRWGYRKAKKRSVNGVTKISRPINDHDCVIAAGRHKAIIEEEVYMLAQYYLAQAPALPVGCKKEIRNPLAGLIICDECGRRMVLRRGAENKPDYLVCHARACTNISASFVLVEDRILRVLRDWLKEQTIIIENRAVKFAESIKSTEIIMKRLETDLKKMTSQQSKVHEAFEQGVYTREQFLSRIQNINDRIGQAKEELSKQSFIYDREKKQLDSFKNQQPENIRFMDLYDKLPTAKERNDLLKQVLEKAVYRKEKSGIWRGVSADEFEIILYPRIPINGS